MKFRLLLFMVGGGLYLMVMGGKGIRDAAAFRKPQTMTCEQFTKSPPGEGWFKVTQCEIAIDEAVYMTEKPKYSSSSTDVGDISKIKEVYIPVHPAVKEGQESKENDPVALVLRTEDPQIIETLKEVYEHSQGSKEQFQQWELQHIKELLLTRDVFGMVQSGLDSDSSTRSEISKLQSTLVPNYAIIDEGRTPTMGASLAKFAGGLILLPLALIIGKGTGSGFGRRKR